MDQLRSDWNAAQSAMGLPFDDKAFEAWMQAQQAPQPAPAPAAAPVGSFASPPVATAAIPPAPVAPAPAQPPISPDEQIRQDVETVNRKYGPGRAMPSNQEFYNQPGNPPQTAAVAPAPVVPPAGPSVSVPSVAPPQAASANDPLETFLDLTKHHESNGRNVMQQAIGPNGGYNPSVGRVTGPSSAQGYYQITNQTWQRYAPKAGVDLSQFPNAMAAPEPVQRQVARTIAQQSGVQNWTNYNSNLYTAVKAAGLPVKGKLFGSGNVVMASAAPPVDQLTNQAQPTVQATTVGWDGSTPPAAMPGVGAAGVPGATTGRGGLGLGLPPNAKPEEVLNAFMNSGSPQAERFKLMMALQNKMPPQSNMASTLANMAAGFLGGRGPAQSLAGGFGGMAQGLGQSNSTANQFQAGNLHALEGALPDPNQETMQERLAGQFMRSGMAPGDAFAAAGVPIDAQRQELLNSQSQAGKPLPSVYQKQIDSGTQELGTLRTARASLDALQQSVQSGELKLDPFHQKWYQAQAALGNPLGDPGVVKYQQFLALQHTLQSDILRTNKGVQTDKDASNAMAMIAGGGITSSDQFMQHSNFLKNRMELEEPVVKQRITNAFTNAKQRMPDGFMANLEASLPGAPPSASPKDIGKNLYGNNAPAQPSPAPATPVAPPPPPPVKAPLIAPGASGLPPDREKALRQKYGF